MKERREALISSESGSVAVAVLWPSIGEPTSFRPLLRAVQVSIRSSRWAGLDSIRPCLFSTSATMVLPPSPPPVEDRRFSVVAPLAMLMLLLLSHDFRRGSKSCRRHRRRRLGSTEQAAGLIHKGEILEELKRVKEVYLLSSRECMKAPAVLKLSKCGMGTKWRLFAAEIWNKRKLSKCGMGTKWRLFAAEIWNKRKLLGVELTLE